MKKIQRSFVSTLKKRFSEQSPLIQILIGPRQVGKTTGVLQFLEEWTGDAHYISADASLSGSHQWILEQWQEALLKGPETLLVIDEIQKINHWSDTIKQLWDEQKIKNANIKLLLLGSSSLSLLKGTSESLAGRFEMIPVYHWDYAESHALTAMTLPTFLEKGGYPKSYEFLADDERRRDYLLNSVINSVLYKDILNFATIKNPALFRQAFEIICCYPAQEISYRKLLGQLQEKGNTELIKHYISLFEGAFLIKTLQKFGNQDFMSKSSSPKILLLAPCFYTLFSLKNEKIPFVFENTVGAKLAQLSGALYYWRQGNDEVDFILKWRNQLLAIEVKSGKKKKVSGLDKFIALYPEAKPVIITSENYLKFIQDPLAFLQKIL